jgi:hypothetical protein
VTSLTSFIVDLQLELLRQRIKEEQNAKEKAELEEQARRRELELQQLRERQAVEQKRLEQLEKIRQEEQQQEAKARERFQGLCPAGYSWYKVRVVGVMHRYIDACGR